MIVIDIEASGINPEKHSIVSLGAVDFRNPKNLFYEECRIWDGAHILEKGDSDELKSAQEINGMTPDQMHDVKKQSVGELIEHFREWVETCSDQVFAGHNPSFDIGFITDSIKRFHVEWSLPKRTIDLHSVCYAHMMSHDVEPPLKNKKSFLSSDTVMNYVGIPAEPKPHIAINGAKWEAEAFSRLFYDRPLFPEFEEYPIPWMK